jgi:septal ring factor EnvC (AmiA/AmiB activator)
MLIGPTITLAKLEEHITGKIDDNKMESRSLTKTLSSLQTEIAATPKFVTEEESGDRIVNKRYVEIRDEFDGAEKKLNELTDNNDFMSKRLEELEAIEEASGGKINKEKEKITLTLNDCLKLGITLE